jgi:hypothetical protein
VFRYNREAFLRDRDQLLAEAAHYEATGESLYLPADVRAYASSEQQARMVEDGWADLLAHVDGFKDKSDREFRVSSAHLLTEVLRLPAEKHNDATLKRLGTAMRKLSWEGPKSLRVDEPLQGTNPPRRRKGVFSGYYRSGPPVQLELEVDQ